MRLESDISKSTLYCLSLIQKWNDLTQQEFCQGPDKIAMIFESTLVLT